MQFLPICDSEVAVIANNRNTPLPRPLYRSIERQLPLGNRGKGLQHELRSSLPH